jgi:hypothetical protein
MYEFSGFKFNTGLISPVFLGIVKIRLEKPGPEASSIAFLARSDITSCSIAFASSGVVGRE